MSESPFYSFGKKKILLKSSRPALECISHTAALGAAPTWGDGEWDPQHSWSPLLQGTDPKAPPDTSLTPQNTPGYSASIPRVSCLQ